MVRIQLRLTEEQFESLKWTALQQSVSMATIVHRAVDRLAESTALPNREELKKRAIAAIGSGHAKEEDLSSKHDDYVAAAFSE